MARKPVAKVSKKDAFLAAFKVTANLSKSAEIVGIERQLHYRWLETDEAYAVAFEQAKHEAAQSLEDEAVRRAHEGILEPVIYQGALCTEVIRDKDGKIQYDRKGNAKERPLVVRKQSDTLLLALLKAWKPEKYRETFKGEIAMPRALTLTKDRLATLTEEELASLIAIHEKLAAVAPATAGTSEAAANED